MALVRKLLTRSLTCNGRKGVSICHDSVRCISQKSRPSLNALKMPVIEFDEEQLSLKVIMPGFTFTDLDKAGNVPVNHIAKFCESIRTMMYAPSMHCVNYTQSDTLPRLHKERLIFMVSSECEFFPGIYNKNILYKPIEATDVIANIGGSSYSHINTAVSLHTQEKLYKMAVRLVLVDTQTRRPIPLPEWFIQHAKNTVKVNVGRVGKLSVPADPHTVSYTIQESDTDYYDHVNQSKYPLLCHNAASILVRNGKLSALEEDLSRQKVKSFKGVYLGENHAGDEVQIRVWESEEEDRRTIHFDVYNSHFASSTFQGTFSFDSQITPCLLL